MQKNENSILSPTTNRIHPRSRRFLAAERMQKIANSCGAEKRSSERFV